MELNRAERGPGAAIGGAVRQPRPAIEDLVVDAFAPERTALVVIDVQNDFCAPGGFFDKIGHPLDSVHRAVDRIEALLPAARAAGLTTVFVRGIYDPPYVSDVVRARNDRMDYPDETCVSGTWGAEYFKLRPEPGDIEIVKHRYSAFIDTGLPAMLRASKITSLILAGVATNVCVESTARDGYMLDHYVMVLEDCCGTYDQTLHEGTLENVRRSFGVVARSDELMNAWEKALATTAR